MRNRTMLFSVIVLLMPGLAQAQLSKLMSKFHEQPCVTVTQLDKSLYGLYKNANLPAEAEQVLQKLDEVNFLNLDLQNCDPGMGKKVNVQFREVLNNVEKYRLIKSHSDEWGKQLIYTHTKNGKVSDLVVWNENPERMDIIELRGDIQLDKITLLTQALNVKGLGSLSTLSPNTKQSYAFSEEMGFSEMQEMQDYFTGIGNMMKGLLAPFGDMTPEEMQKIGNSLHNLEMLDNSLNNPDKALAQFDDNSNIVSNSVRITEENGKTKIKIDSKNSNMVYVIDGREAPKDDVRMPEGIMYANIIPSKEDFKKSYLFITSKDKIGEFISYKDGNLIFKYNSQEYKFNLDKVKQPLLVIDGRLIYDFSIEPSHILQIRPISPVEKKVGYYPTAEVIINTK